MEGRRRPVPGPGPAKPKDLGTKLAALEAEPAVIDHLILLRPEDDLALTGKSKSFWQEASGAAGTPRLEAMSLDAFAVLYGFPRWLGAVTEALPQGQPLPNLADLLAGTLREAAGTGVHADSRRVNGASRRACPGGGPDGGYKARRSLQESAEHSNFREQW